MTRTRTTLLATALVGLLAAGCGDDGSTTATGDAAASDTTAVADEAATSTTLAQPVIDPGDGGDYAPELDPADFVARIDNPYLPMVPGNRWVYEETNGDGDVEHIEVVVLEETRDIGGIDATVVRDTVTLDGVLVEDTFDWYAQDREGNVWYLGEDVSNYDEHGDLDDHDGSFEHGVDGAYGGIVMPADPQPGDAYRQEFWIGRGRGPRRGAAPGRDRVGPRR